MKINFKGTYRLFLSTAALFGFASIILPQASYAQLNRTDGQAGYGAESSNPCANAANGGNFDMFSLIHCANFNNNNWDANQQGEDINSMAEQFRRRQQQILGGKTTGSPVLITPNPGGVNGGPVLSPGNAFPSPTRQPVILQRKIPVQPSVITPNNPNNNGVITLPTDVPQGNAK
jgi:hypothetical protein